MEDGSLLENNQPMFYCDPCWVTVIIMLEGECPSGIRRSEINSSYQHFIVLTTRHLELVGLQMILLVSENMYVSDKISDILITLRCFDIQV